MSNPITKPASLKYGDQVLLTEFSEVVNVLVNFKEERIVQLQCDGLDPFYCTYEDLMKGYELWNDEIREALRAKQRAAGLQV